MRRTLLSLVSSVMVLLVGCAGQQVQQNSANGQPTQSITPTGTLSTQDDAKRRARIRVELAANYYAQGQYDVALGEIKEALRSDQNLPEAYSMLGLIYMSQQDNRQAEESFQYALKLSPGNADINNNYGWFLCQTARVKESIPMFLAATQTPVLNTAAKAYVNAGICSMKVGDLPNAERYFAKGFELEPSNPLANFNLGTLYLRRGDLERARFYGRRAYQGSNVTPTPESLMLGIKIERAAGDGASEAVLISQLKKLYPNSRQALAVDRGELVD